jgi:hypothetical protein
LFSFLLIIKVATHFETEFYGTLILEIILLVIFLYSLLVAYSKDTISIYQNDIIRFEGFRKIGLTKKIKIGEVKSIVKDEIIINNNRTGFYYMIVETEKMGYPGTIIFLSNLTPEKADFIKDILDKTVEDRKSKPQK